MRSLLSKIYRRLTTRPVVPSPLSDNGERVDIDLRASPRYAQMDMYQKSHYKRYLFANQYVREGMVCGDFACGTGYGTALLAGQAGKAIGIDIQQHVIDEIAGRYSDLPNVEFMCQDLRSIEFDAVFDLIVSFETIEHVEEEDVHRLLMNFTRALKDDGMMIFSTPYCQKRTREAVEMGFHLTFDIDEAKIASWLAQAGLVADGRFYQNYKSHEVVSSLDEKDFIVCIARKAENAA